MTPVKRDASGFPIQFELDSRTAQAVEEEVQRIRAEKQKQKGGKK